MRPTVSVRLLGRFAVCSADQVLLDHVPQKARELLAYLIVNRGRPHPRECLAELLWGEADPALSRKYLRQALWQLHAGLLTLGSEAASRLVHQEPGWVELTLDRHTWVDTVEFEERFDSVRGIVRPNSARIADITRALQLYQGDLLEGHGQSWCIYERDRFRQMYLTMLDKLIGHMGERHEYEAAIAYATLALRCDPARERTHLTLMNLHYQAGDRTGALHQYDRCVRALRDDLDVEPGREIQELRARICAGHDPRGRRGGNGGRTPMRLVGGEQEGAAPPSGSPPDPVAVTRHPGCRAKPRGAPTSAPLEV